jgi:hypothetical protein
MASLSKLSRVSALLLFSLTSAWAAESQEKLTIHLHRSLGPDYACSLYQRAVQFVSDDELLLMAGPSGDCYRSVNQLELVVLSLHGKVIARKNWPSTCPGLVFAIGRIAVVADNDVQILDDHLRPVQSIPLPAGRGFPVLSVYAPGILEIKRDGRTVLYKGDPLEPVEIAAAVPPDGVYPIFHLDDGTLLGKRGSSLVEVSPDAVPKSLADLSWVVPPCMKYEYCQDYNAGTSYQTVAAQKSRVLIWSNGSRLPVTDAAGLFPYFRVAVFDLSAGHEIYREEDSFKTGRRGAAISPNGDLLITYDGSAVIVHKLDLPSSALARSRRISGRLVSRT